MRLVGEYGLPCSHTDCAFFVVCKQLGYHVRPDPFLFVTMKIHQLEGYIQLIYLVEYPHGLMLLDGCSRADVSLIRSYIVEVLQRPVEDLKVVVVTHLHPDHAGAAHILRKITGCKIIASDVPGQWYSGFSGRLMHLTDMLLAHWVAGRIGKKRKRVWYGAYLYPDIKLPDASSIPQFEDWQVIYCQGHTDRDISLLHNPTGKIYVADLMVKVRKRLIPPYPLFYPNRYRQSLDKLQQLAPSRILLAHGGEVSLSAEDYAQLRASAPKVPMTHWRSVKAKLKSVFIRR